jgi:DNA repair protein RecN (Recombination protein N)
MLVELIIRDLAIIEHSVLAFGPGLNVISGETGAGKSLLVGALELLLGTRPKPGRVRTGADKAVVEARFVVPAGREGSSIARWARRHMPQLVVEWTRGGDEERELILGRSVLADGKTRAYVNNRPVTREALADLAPRLFEIHGQNDHQKLHDASEQLRLVDSFGKLDETVAAYRRARETWRELAETILRLRAEAATRRASLDLARFQLSELTAAAPRAGERAELEPERDLLRHAASIKEGLARVVAELSEADDAVLDRLRGAARFVEGWKDQIAALGPPAESLEAALVHLEDGARALQSLAERLEVDPARLEEIEGRLAELERLERKYKTDGAGLAAKFEELRAQVKRLESDEESSVGLGAEVGAARAALLAKAGELRRARKAVRPKLVKAVEKAFADLGLPKASFDVRLAQRGDEDGVTASDPSDPAVIEADQTRFGERGIDRIEFLLSANPGEPLSKLSQVASGGETARIMLALRSALAASGERRTLLFDEIDSGVGGRLGPAVGAHLEHLGQHHQVLCVTHLPAIAAMARRHLKASKFVEGGRTRTAVEELRDDARVQEIADMIAGGADQETARAEARRLLGLTGRGHG